MTAAELTARASDIYPGEAEARRLGYTLSSSNGNKSKATYTKNVGDEVVFLSIRQGNELIAALEAYAGMVRLSITDFSFPNVNFAMFEKQIAETCAASPVRGRGRWRGR